MEKLQKTTEYNLFTEDRTNRSVTKVGKLVASMEVNGFLPAHPIHVVPGGGDKFKVKDGQHRLAAAEKLGIAVYFVVCEDRKLSIPMINDAQRPWTLADYVNSWEKQGRPDYARLRQLQAGSKIPLWICASLLSGKHSGKHIGQTVKDGKFKITSLELFNEVANVIGACLSSGVKFARNYKFVAAVCDVLAVPGVSALTLIQRIRSVPSLIKIQATTEEFITNLEKVYNHRARVITPISVYAINMHRKNTPEAIQEAA